MLHPCFFCSGLIWRDVNETYFKMFKCWCSRIGAIYSPLQCCLNIIRWDLKHFSVNPQRLTYSKRVLTFNRGQYWSACLTHIQHRPAQVVSSSVLVERPVMAAKQGCDLNLSCLTLRPRVSPLSPWGRLAGDMDIHHGWQLYKPLTTRHCYSCVITSRKSKWRLYCLFFHGCHLCCNSDLWEHIIFAG